MKDSPIELVESTLAQIWQEVLGVPSVSSGDDFFLLGGDSVKALQVVNRIRSHPDLSAEITVRTVFDAETLHDLASLVRVGSADSGAAG
jgi:aryl carrier-like protein